MVRASLITIGDEILIGQIVDTNSSWLGTQLSSLGLTVVSRHSVGDEVEHIKKVLKIASDESDVVIVTGGLGPTKDDVTKQAICEYFGVSTYFDEELFKWVTEIFRRYGRTPLDSHRQQCFLPKGCKIFSNKVGTAPGMLMKKDDTAFVFMPGVPLEMKHIFDHELKTWLKEGNTLRPILYKTIRVAGVGESVIAGKIEAIENKFPKGIKIAYLPSLSQVRVRVQAEGKLGNGKDTLERIDEACRLITDVLGESVYGWDDDSLQEVVGQMLRGKNLKLTLAESCTGGYLGHMITSVPGSSDYFVGSIISYSNDLKMAELDVPAIVLKEHGAVSEETVRYMAKGALRRYKADIALSVSGIAGPDGGSEEKPVGTVWMCVTNGENTKTAKLQLSKTRTLNIEQASIIGLNMIRKFLLGLEMA
jgi:nicotinamide-nucleotide amidase